MWLAKSDKLCGKFNICIPHCSVQPSATGEQKTKPTQNSVRELRGLGLSPDLVSLLSHSYFYKRCTSVCVCVSVFPVLFPVTLHIYFKNYYCPPNVCSCSFVVPHVGGHFVWLAWLHFMRSHSKCNTCLQVFPLFLWRAAAAALELILPSYWTNCWF